MGFDKLRHLLMPFDMCQLVFKIWKYAVPPPSSVGYKTTGRYDCSVQEKGSCLLIESGLGLFLALVCLKDLSREKTLKEKDPEQSTISQKRRRPKTPPVKQLSLNHLDSCDPNQLRDITVGEICHNNSTCNIAGNTGKNTRTTCTHVTLQDGGSMLKSWKESVSSLWDVRFKTFVAMTPTLQTDS